MYFSTASNPEINGEEKRMKPSRAIGCDGHQGICLKGNKSNNDRTEIGILFEGCQGFTLAMNTLVAPFQAPFFLFLDAI